uniref:Uncharacterized protein n=1 Tax=Tetradesmus obliquus TaxID=3088 RepID=A0A383VES4_TETOB|eukprot:jgi/Sobl393_1/17660/SZX64058.1
MSANSICKAFLALQLVLCFLSWHTAVGLPAACPVLEPVQCPQRPVAPGTPPVPKPPAETLEQQAAIIARLQDMLAADNALLGSASSSGVFCMQQPLHQQQVGEQQGIDSNLQQPPSRTTGTNTTAVYNGPRSQVNRTLTFLNSSRIAAGVDVARAGTLSWVSSPCLPPPYTNENLVSDWDQGRLIQQSYYGCPDGSCWVGHPWVWNPVQGGSWENKRSITTKAELTQGQRIYTEGYPRNWASQELRPEIVFGSEYTLGADGDHIVAHYTAAYNGNITHPILDQEVPAVFVRRPFSVLARYEGEQPWTKDENITYTFPGASNAYGSFSESWVAWLDPETGTGIGVYQPHATLFTAYRVPATTEASDMPWHTSYSALLVRAQFYPGMPTFEYEAYIAVGRLSAIRATLEKIHASLAPAGKAAAAARPLQHAEGVQPMAGNRITPTQF